MSSLNLSDCPDLEYFQFLNTLQMMIWHVEERIPGSENTQLSDNAVCAQWMRENDGSGQEGLMKFWQSHDRGIVEKATASERGLS
jgi:hypothetical protein